MATIKPTAAKLTVVDETNKAHEIELHPAFGAILHKAIRRGPKRFDLQGCLPPGSAHANPENQHWQVYPENFGASDVEGWNL